MNSEEHAGLWAAYLDTLIEFSDPDGGRWRLRARAADESGAGVAPEFLRGDFVAWVITAWNPESALVSAEQNAAAHRELLADVEAAGLVALPAFGMSRDRSWSEESVLVVGASQGWVLGIAEKYKQNAVFRWTPESLDVVGC
ncbi:MAG: DUF3293 domain-containing protein [Candidatus Nanopelagicales bacterium]